MSDERPLKWPHLLVVLALLTLLAAGLRLWQLDARAPWQEERATLLAARGVNHLQPLKPVGEPFTHADYASRRTWRRALAARAADPQPPVHLLLVYLCLNLWGTGDAILRLPSVVAGTLTVPALYLLARRLAGPGTALFAALLLAIAPLHVSISQDASPYSLATLCVVVATYLLLCAVPPAAEETTDKARLALVVAYAAVGVLALATQYLAAAPLALHLVYLWACRRGRGGGGLLVAWLVIAGVAAALLVPDLFSQLRAARSTAADPAVVVSAGPPTLFEGAYRLFVVGTGFTGSRFGLQSHALPISAVFAIFLLTLLLAGRGSIQLIRDKRVAGWLIVGLAPAGPGLALLITALTAQTGALVDREYLFALPPTVLLLAVGAMSVRGWGRALATQALVLISALGLADVYNDEFSMVTGNRPHNLYQQQARALRAGAKPEETIVYERAEAAHLLNQYWAGRNPQVVIPNSADIPEFLREHGLAGGQRYWWVGRVGELSVTVRSIPLPPLRGPIAPGLPAESLEVPKTPER